MFCNLSAEGFANSSCLISLYPKQPCACLVGCMQPGDYQSVASSILNNEEMWELPTGKVSWGCLYTQIIQTWPAEQTPFLSPTFIFSSSSREPFPHQFLICMIWRGLCGPIMGVWSRSANQSISFSQTQGNGQKCTHDTIRVNENLNYCGKRQVLIPGKV